MRYLTIRLRPTESSAFHPVGKRLAEEPSVQREAIHHIELLANGSVLTLAEGSGDRNRYEQLMEESPHVEDVLVTGDERWFATSRFTAQGPVQKLLEWRRESDLVVDTPIVINTDGSMRITYIGADPDFRELYDRSTDAIDLDIEVVETGQYDPTAKEFLRVLTSRQQEILQAAVEVGYYEVPRSATQEDVAEEVGIAPTTAGSHLRKIESRILGGLCS